MPILRLHLRHIAPYFFGPHRMHYFSKACIPYTAKLSRGKTFAVVHKTQYSLENFRGASGRGHLVLYTANDLRGKLLRLAKKLQKLSPLESFAVYGISQVKVRTYIITGAHQVQRTREYVST